MTKVQKKVLRQKAPRVVAVVLTVTLLAVALFLTLRSAVDLPVVYKSVPGTVVGCAGPDGKKAEANSPTCQNILHGQYEVVWVTPG